MINKENQVRLPRLCFTGKEQPYDSLNLVMTLNVNLLSYNYCFNKELMEYLCFLNIETLTAWFDNLEAYLIETLKVKKRFEFPFIHFPKVLMETEMVHSLADEILDGEETVAEVLFKHFPIPDVNASMLTELAPLVHLK